MNVLREASLDKVPEPLLPLIDSSVDAYREVLGPNIKAVYAAGSWVRGEMNGDSDADFLGATVTTPGNEELEALDRTRDALLADWVPEHINDIELKVFDLSRPDERLTIVRRTVTQVDGCLVYGEAVPGNIFSEQPLPEIIGAFAQLFVDVKGRLDEGSALRSVRHHARHVTAKLALRNMEWIAVMKGAAVSSSMARYIGDITTFAPELRKDAERCWQLYSQTDTGDDVQDEIDKLFDGSLSVLQQHGIELVPPAA